MSLDKAKILKGSDIIINEFITLKQPKVGAVIDYGEQRFFNTFYTFCSIPSDMKSVLWDNGLDWNKMKDWELFLNLSRNISKEETSLILGDLDFSQMELMQNSETKEIVLVQNNCIITEEIYLDLTNNVREMLGIIPKREKAKNTATKLALIEEDRINRSHPKKNTDDSFLCSAIISLVNTEEFSYTYESVMDITIYQLMKSFYQIQNKKSACALYQGSMGGFVDTSKIDKKAFQWIYTNDKRQ